MYYVHIPEKQIEPNSHFYTMPALVEEKEKHPIFNGIYDTDMLELKHFMEEFEKFTDEQIDKKWIGCQALLGVLSGIYKDPDNAYHSTLLRFMGENKFLMMGILTRALLERGDYEVSSGKNLPGMFLKIVEWQAQYKEGSFFFYLAQKLLDAFQPKEIIAFGDLKAWIQENCLHSHSCTYFEPSSDRLHPLLAALGLEGKGVLNLLEQVYEKALAYVNSPATSFETKQFIQTVLLPQMERFVGRESDHGKTATSELQSQMLSTKPEEFFLEKGSFTRKAEKRALSQEAIRSFTQYLYENLAASKDQIQTILKQIANAGEFPVIVPYPPSNRPSQRFPKWRFRFRRPPRREEHLEDEEAEESRFFP